MIEIGYGMPNVNTKFIFGPLYFLLDFQLYLGQSSLVVQNYLLLTTHNISLCKIYINTVPVNT